MKIKIIIPIICFTLSAIIASAQTINNELRLSIGGKTEGKITLEEFLADSIIHVLPEDSGYVVASYRYDVKGKFYRGRDSIVTGTDSKTIYPPQFRIGGNRIDDIFRSYVSGLKKGEKIKVEYVTVKKRNSTDASAIKVSPLTLTIAD